MITSPIEHALTFFDVTINIIASGLDVFIENGTSCYRCGLEGNVFIIEQKKSNEKYYASPKAYVDGDFVQLRMNNLFPRNYGSFDSMSNKIAICEPCQVKGNSTVPGIDELNALIISLVNQGNEFFPSDRLVLAKDGTYSYSKEFLSKQSRSAKKRVAKKPPVKDINDTSFGRAHFHGELISEGQLSDILPTMREAYELGEKTIDILGTESKISMTLKVLLTNGFTCSECGIEANFFMVRTPPNPTDRSSPCLHRNLLQR